MCNNMKFFEKKKKINKILTEISLMKFPTPIPLCIMTSMEVVYLALKNDVAFLVKSFVNGCIPSFASFYVSLEHEDGHMQGSDEGDMWYMGWYVGKKKREEFKEFLVENNFQ